MIGKKCLVLASIAAACMLAGMSSAEAGYVRCHGGCCYHYNNNNVFKYKKCGNYRHHHHCSGHINKYGKCCHLGICAK